MAWVGTAFVRAPLQPDLSPVCPQLPTTEPSFQVLEKMNKEKSPTLVTNKSANHHPQMEKDKGPSGPRVSNRSVIFLEDNLGSHPLILYLNKEKIASLLQPF